MLAIRGVGDGIKAREIVHKHDRAVARVLAGYVLSDGVVELHDAVDAIGGPARAVQRQQVGEQDADLGVLVAHLLEQDVVGLEDVADRLSAQQHVVGSQEHEDHVGGVDGVEPDCQVALGGVVGCL